MADYQRFNIYDDKIFKTLDLYRNRIVINNENENKLIIELSSIIETLPVKENKKQFSIKYYSNGIKNVDIYSSDDRDNLLSNIITMKDKSSKIISDYSIETFKCYNLIILNSQLLKEIGQKLYEVSQGKDKKKSLSNSKLIQYVSFCTLYRTYSVINKLSSQELKTYYINLSKIIKIQIAPNIYGLILEDINKIRIAIIPFNQKDVLTIKNLIISYASKYLSYEIKYEESNDYLKEISSERPILSLSKAKSTVFRKSKAPSRKSQEIDQLILNINNDPSIKNIQPSELNIGKKISSSTAGKVGEINKEMKSEDFLFSYNNVRRVLYNKNKAEIILKGYNDYLRFTYVTHNEPDLIINLHDILIIAVKGKEENYFEILLNDTPPPRFIFEVQNKNKIINDIIELLLKYFKTKNINENFLLFSYKTSIKKYMRHIDDPSIRKSLEERKIEEIMYVKDDIKEIIIEIVVNYYFLYGKSQEINKLLKDDITKILIQQFDSCYNKCINCDKKDIKANIILLNFFLIFFKNLGFNLVMNDNGKKICEKIFQKLTQELEDKSLNKKNENIIILNDYALFYNAIHIIEYFSLYKQIMLLNVMTFNQKENMDAFGYNSMYINFLLILFETKLTEMKEIPDIYIPESSYFFLLLTLSKIMFYEPTNVSRNAISLLSTILEKVTEKKQREIKEILLKKTMIFYSLINIYLINNNADIIVTRNCLKIFQILLNQYYEMSIPIKNIFPFTLIKNLGAKKEPDKWDKKECEKFFIDILKDYYEEKIIWDKECKNELIEALTNLIGEYEESVKKKLTDLNPSYDEVKINNFKSLINLIFNPDTYDNLKFSQKKGVEYKPFYCIDYLNYKVNYGSLEKAIYILDTYINVWIDKNKKEKMEVHIQNPHKYWKKMKKEIVKYNDEKKLIIINVMKFIYEKYFEIIGNFGSYNILDRIYKVTKSKNLQEQIRQLFYLSIKIGNEEIEENNMRDIISENINYIKI